MFVLRRFFFVFHASFSVKSFDDIATPNQTLFSVAKLPTINRTPGPLGSAMSVLGLSQSSQSTLSIAKSPRLGAAKLTPRNSSNSTNTASKNCNTSVQTLQNSHNSSIKQPENMITQHTEHPYCTQRPVTPAATIFVPAIDHKNALDETPQADLAASKKTDFECLPAHQPFVARRVGISAPIVAL